MSAVDLIGLLQELVEQHGEETDVALAVGESRQEIVAVAVDQDIRRDDDPEVSGPPLVWLIAEPLEGGYAPPRRATVRPV